MIEVFQSRTATGERQAILVEFPGLGLRAVGFVTRTIKTPDGTSCYKVFVPTTPNPTTGFLQFVAMERAELLDMTTEEALRLIMSGSVLAPAALVKAP